MESCNCKIIYIIIFIIYIFYINIYKVNNFFLKKSKIKVIYDFDDIYTLKNIKSEILKNNLLYILFGNYTL